jgi:class 3 adenylate cyclase
MAMFGAPLASVHHSLDACEAALEMQQAMHDSGVAIRVGLHSGEIVVLKVGTMKRLAVMLPVQ